MTTVTTEPAGDCGNESEMQLVLAPQPGLPARVAFDAHHHDAGQPQAGSAQRVSLVDMSGSLDLRNPPAISEPPGVPIIASAMPPLPYPPLGYFPYGGSPVIDAQTVHFEPPHGSPSYLGLPIGAGPEGVPHMGSFESCPLRHPLAHPAPTHAPATRAHPRPHPTAPLQTRPTRHQESQHHRDQAAQLHDPDRQAALAEKWQPQNPTRHQSQKKGMKEEKEAEGSTPTGARDLSDPFAFLHVAGRVAVLRRTQSFS